jgi:hypothetical protein
MEKSECRIDLEEELANLKAELKERELSLPAHSIRPHQLSAIEELESRIRSLEDQLNLLPPKNTGD